MIVWLLIGMLSGVFIGMTVMALCAVGSHDSRMEEIREKDDKIKR